MKNSVRLAHFVDGHNNNFNLIRFVAASLVIFSHCYPLTGREKFLTDFGYDAGWIAVDIFFLVSGFLVTMSLLSRQDVGFFCWSRFLRIFPGLVVNLLVCILIIGLFFTTLPIYDYVVNPQTLRFFTRNLFMFIGEEGALPGVFETNPKTYVNASLWTLPYEVKMYVSLGVLGLVAHLQKRFSFEKFLRVFITVSAVVLVAYVTLKYVQFHDTAYIKPHYRFGSMFFTGSFFYVHRSRIVLSTPLFLVCVGVLVVVALATDFLFVAYTILLGYPIFFLAYVPVGIVRKFNRLPDYSYGLYIYGYPIQQSFVTIWPTISIAQMLIYSFCATLVLAALSWRFVEKFALSFKKYFRSDLAV